MHRLFGTTALAAAGAFILATGALAAGAPPATRPAAPAAPAPRLANGHPDFTGYWTRRPAPGAGPANRSFLVQDAGKTDSGGELTVHHFRDGNFNYAEIDAEFDVKLSEDMPVYKPEFWDKVRNNEEYGYRRPADPGYGCGNPGLVRMGVPVEMFETPGKITLIYAGGGAGASGPWVRDIPTDGRKLPSPDDYGGVNPQGVAVGHWEGDTLVIETVDFPGDATWYSTRGWIGSAEAKVTERLHYQGDTLVYDQTVEDPAFQKPWVRPTVYLQASKNPSQTMPVQPPCVEIDGAYLPPSNK
jgi:hypothetical protein